MKISDNTHVAVIDGERFVWLRNSGTEADPQLEAVDTPEMDGTNRSQGGQRHSITSGEPAGNDLDEAAHVAAVAEWLNHQAKTSKIEHLIVVADKRSLGELRRHYHVELEQRLVGEIGKEMTNQSLGDITAAIAAA